MAKRKHCGGSGGDDGSSSKRSRSEGEVQPSSVGSNDEPTPSVEGAQVIEVIDLVSSSSSLNEGSGEQQG
ncbi:hypothetical protein BSKO_02060 [Bryopsis sp. KO-2023]|nr:hypothetical protein BSKO_02060 [Bryopsis sp. KO-2023]